MKKPYIIVLVFMLFALFSTQTLNAQKTLSVKISADDDDQEEWLPGSNQTKVVGDLDAGSSDLEFGLEGGGNDPQMVGMRFTNITIPKGAIITSAYIQFTVDATSKNASPCVVTIKGQAADNPVTFNPATKFDITSRPKTSDSIIWTVSGSTWNTVGSNGPDQRTANIASIIQGLVNRNGWASGNALALFMTGTGTREVESADGNNPGAAVLVVNYIEPKTFTKQITAADDDQEEWLAAPNQTKTVGDLDAGSSDLEFGFESGTTDPQMVGMRFPNINIPKGSIITNAYIQFTVDATSKNADPCAVIIKAEANDNPATFNPATKFDLTSRPKSNDSVTWTVTGSSWATVGSNGPDQRTPNLKNLVQTIVNRTNWANNYSMAFYMYGIGTREVESADGNNPGAPTLVVEYIEPTTLQVQVKDAEDDQEEWLAGSNQTKTVGDLDAGSSDLEFGLESTTTDPQMVGIRFQNVTIPKGALIQKAYIQFTVDATSKNADPCVVTIKTENNDNPVVYNPAVKFDITSRPKSSDSVVWTVGGTSWNTIGSATADQRTADLKKLVQGIVDRSGWTSGNSMAFYLNGTGTREVESRDGNNPGAAILVVEYLGGAGGSGPTPKIVTTNFPIVKKQQWSYNDSGYLPAANWAQEAYKGDTLWKFGAATLGYGEVVLGTTISFGSNANNKYPTAYFRKPFNVADINTLSDSLEMNVLADDGVIVYVNGTEVFRRGMPSGVIANNTKATTRSEGALETVYFLKDIPKTLLKNGVNIIAAEVHQFDSVSSDLTFDLELKNRTSVANPPASTCTSSTDAHIACFTSVLPTDQVDTLAIPSTHSFQAIFKQGDPYKNQAGTIPGAHDFTGYIAKGGSSTNGWVSVNHENNPGAVSILDVHFDCTTGLWVVDSSKSVDFSGDLVKTERNCSGGVTPWETVITSEETLTSGDANSDGYDDVGWNVEIDPKTKRVKEYGNGKREKLWALGRISHENVVCANDSVTVYQGEDDGSGNVFKFVADQKGNLSSGKLYALKLNSGLVSNEPTSSVGTWVLVPNTTKIERNTTKALAAGLGATPFNGVEDVEISPIDGKIYFTAKGNSRVYRFSDNGTTVSNFETFIGGASYRINIGNEIISEPWGTGNDNLTFDDRGNLWVLQDGSRNHIWVVRPNHTQANPKVEVFMVSPYGSEPTGMTFSPDYKYMFVSIQSPAAITLTQKDVAGNTVKFDRSNTLVIARNESWTGGPTMQSITGPATANRNSTQNYSVTNRPNSNYNWFVTGGTQQSGGNTNAISVLWSNGITGNVKVLEGSKTNGCKADTATVTVSLTNIGVAENNISGLKVYPNPVNNELTIETENAVEYAVIDVTGRTVITGSKTAGNNQFVNVSSLQSGVYFLQLNENGKTATVQFIKN